MGLAMDWTGVAAGIANNAVNGAHHFVPAAHKSLVMFACVYLFTTILTEILSNRAVAVLMASIAIRDGGKTRDGSRTLYCGGDHSVLGAFANSIGISDHHPWPRSRRLPLRGFSPHRRAP